MTFGQMAFGHVEERPGNARKKVVNQSFIRHDSGLLLLLMFFFFFWGGGGGGPQLGSTFDSLDEILKCDH